MLINLYNGKPVEDFHEHYANVAHYFEILINLERSVFGRELQADDVLDQFNKKIDSIVGTVRDKLNEDANKEELVTYPKTECLAPASAGNRKRQT